MTYDDERTLLPQTAPSPGDATPAEGAPDDLDVDRWFESSSAEADDDTADNPTEDEDAEPAPPARSRRGRKPKLPVGDPGLAIFVDSSALIALVDRDDSTHAAAVAAYGNLLSEGYKLFTTNYVIAETFDLLSTGVGPDVARRFLRDCKIAVYHADEQDERRAKRVVLRQTGPNGLSLTDAVSFVVMERLNVADAFAVDPGFLSNAT